MRPFRFCAALAVAVSLALPAQGFGSSGAYLAARHAGFSHDFIAASEYYTRALALEPGNGGLMEAVITMNVSAGFVDRAFPVARRMLDGGFSSQSAGLVRLVDLAGSGAFAELAEELDTAPGSGALVDSLALGWVLYGTGDVSGAMAAFDTAAESRGLASFARTHKALALALAGDFEGADEILSGRAAGPLSASRRGVMAHIQVLSQLDRNEDAREMISAGWGATPPPLFADYDRRLAAGETLPFDVVTSPAEGIGEVFFGVAGALLDEQPDNLTLLYARLAHHLAPDSTDATLLVAQLLEELGQLRLAGEAYAEVPADSPAFLAAEMGRADALREGGKPDAAVEVLRQLARSYPEERSTHRHLGDTLRRLERFEEAREAYDSAVALVDTPERTDWPLYFARGIALERIDSWPEAEADFRAALELEPDQPQVLNYLGYSLVELRTDLDEALDMIERAVAARPDDGYIVDSLGWVLYRLGRYDEAVGHMERAAELMPVDPIINDHLGDVYWAVGRQMEARFQWKRAMSFDPEPEEAERIRRKLEVGLDIVLDEEGAAPLDVAQDDG